MMRPSNLMDGADPPKAEFVEAELLRELLTRDLRLFLIA